MINVSAIIKNPWSKGIHRSLISKSGKLFRNKYWEAEIYLYTPNILGISIDTSWRGSDHAGISIELILLKYTFCVKLYDSRHWDYDNNCWSLNKDY